jgi:hypothetical protein
MARVDDPHDAEYQGHADPEKAIEATQQDAVRQNLHKKNKVV